MITRMTKNRIPISIRLIWLISAIAFSLLLLFNVSFLLQIPPVWPDEVFIADSALNILSENRNGTDLLKGTLPGVENFGWGYPPLFFYTTAIWFKMFGFSIYNQRLLSAVLGLVFLPLFFLVTAKLVNNQQLRHKLPLILLLVITALLATDEAFIKAMHIGRPEIEVLVFGFVGLFFYLKSLDKKSGNIFSIACGFFISLAFLSHYLAIIFLSGFFLHSLLLNPKKFLTTKKHWLILAAFLIPVFIWLFLISNNINHLLNDVALRLRYKTTSPYWIWLVFSSSSLITKLQYILYFIITWELALEVLITRSKNGLLVLLLLFFSWFWTYQWQAEYSFIFTVIFTYLGLAYLIFANFDIKKNITQAKFKIFIALSLFMLIGNSWNHLNHLLNSANGNYDYHLYTNQILELVPDNTTVYLSAIPDPYYGFKDRGSNKLHEYPIMAAEKASLLKILDETDYIVFNAPLESIVVGDVVNPYISANSADIKTIGGKFEYRAFIIKLKPRNSRTH